MAANSTTGGVGALHRLLGTWDLILLNVAAIVGLRWLSTTAQIGPSSLVIGAGLVFCLQGRKA